jgi:hypothetical protein
MDPQRAITELQDEAQEDGAYDPPYNRELAANCEHINTTDTVVRRGQKVQICHDCGEKFFRCPGCNRADESGGGIYHAEPRAPRRSDAVNYRPTSKVPIQHARVVPAHGGTHGEPPSSSDPDRQEPVPQVPLR